MKKILFLFLATMLLSCSNSDDGNPASQASKLNPPEWIHGTWLLRNLDGTMSQSGFRFTPDDFCVVSFGMSACHKSQLEQFPNNSEVYERITPNEYQVRITIGSNTTEFEFEKTIDGKIMWADNPSHPTYEKQ